ncbi:hypothetical protein F4677DRAFT_404632 [Hypoxylon crocopeplum]|nr:hypothetical protein F4677DRAFT_404632 [Hypoxylon crocopeplum]
MAGSLAALKNLPCPAGDKCDAFQCLFKHDKDSDAVAPVKGSARSFIEATTTTPALPGQVSPRKRIKLDTATSHLISTQAGLGETASGQSQMDQDQDTKPLQGEPTNNNSNSDSHLVVGKKPRSSVGEADQGNGLKGNGVQGGTIQGESGSGERIKRPSTKVDGTSTAHVRNISISSSVTQDIQRRGTLGKNSPSKTQEAKRLSTSPSTVPTRNVPTSIATKATPKKPETLNPRLLKSSPAQHDTRLKLVKALYEQYARLNSALKKEASNEESKKLVLSDQELIVKTLDDEQEIATKRFQIYGNVIRNRIMACKKMDVAKWKEERIQATKGSGSQNASKASSAYEPIVTGLTPAQEVDFLHRLVWPFNGLSEFGYVSSIPSDDNIQKARESVEASGNVEVCDRCTRRFQVFPGRREEDGALASNGTCTYHPGKTYFTERGPGKTARGQKKYRCCHQNVDDESGGCTTAATHVFKTTDVNRLASLLNFAETPANPDVPADRAVCFDCEMGYTVYGLELIRVTILSWPDYEVLVDILVQPFGEVLDLNTRYSGVTPEDMVSAERWVPGQDHKPTVVPSTDPANASGTEQKQKLKIASSPKAARDLLFSLIGPKTPVLGHGLENDLNSMRIIHHTCVDTVLLYPHKRQLPIRNSLRYLMDTLLGRAIQKEGDGDVPEGHDSAEDAKAAGDLVKLKVRDEWKDLKMKGWSLLEDGSITPPDQAWTVVGGVRTKRPGF